MPRPISQAIQSTTRQTLFFSYQNFRRQRSISSAWLLRLRLLSHMFQLPPTSTLVSFSVTLHHPNLGALVHILPGSGRSQLAGDFGFPECSIVFFRPVRSRVAMALCLKRQALLRQPAGSYPLCEPYANKSTSGTLCRWFHLCHMKTIGGE